MKCELCNDYYDIEKCLPCFTKRKISSYIMLEYQDHHENNKKIYIVDLERNK